MNDTSGRKTVSIWVRVSTEQAAAGESPLVHELRGRSYAEARNWDILTVYHLEGVSGKSVMQHAEAQRMLDDVRSGRITGLVFSKMARLARNTRELLEFADIFNKHGADLISIQEEIDTSSPGGKLFFTLLAAITQWEREEIVERIRASIPARAKLGKPLNGNATLGYCWVSKRLVPDHETAPVRRLLFVLLAKHRRVRTVSDIMNSAGYRTANGALFNFRTVRRLIRDSTPVGLHKSNYTMLSEGGIVRRKPESEWVISQVEPIVSKELWGYCNWLLDQRKEGDRPGRRPKHLFGGLLWCWCGQKMYVPSNNRKYVCRSCHKKVSISALEELFAQRVSPEIGTPMSAAVIEAIADEPSVCERLLKIVQSSASKSESELVKLEELCARGHIPSSSYTRRRALVDQRIEGLNRERIRLSLKLKLLQSKDASRVPAGGACARTLWPSMTLEEKLLLVENCVRRVDLGNEGVIFHLRNETTERVMQYPAPNNGSKELRPQSYLEQAQLSP